MTWAAVIFAWEDGTIIPAIGTNSYNVNLTGSDSINYSYTNVTNPTMVSVNVAKATPNVTIAALPTATIAGGTTTLTATVSGLNPTGTVDFYNGSTLLGTGTLSNGVATYTWGNVTAGNNILTAVYSGDTNYSTATSSALSYNVSQITPIVTITASQTTTVGGTITLTATVSGLNPTGTVDFYNGSTLLGTETLSKGVATYTLDNITAGNNSLTAVYQGDTNYAKSTSAALSYSINKGNQTPITIKGLPTTIYYGNGGISLSYIGGSGNGKVKWSVNGTSVSINADGFLQILNTGYSVIMISKDSDENYNSTSSLIAVNVLPTPTKKGDSTNNPTQNDEPSSSTAPSIPAIVSPSPNPSASTSPTPSVTPKTTKDNSGNSKSYTTDNNGNTILKAITYVKDSNGKLTPNGQVTIDVGNIKGYISGYPDGTYRATNTMTRGEVASIIFNLVKDANKNSSVTGNFIDVKSTDWYANAIKLSCIKRHIKRQRKRKV